MVPTPSMQPMQTSRSVEPFRTFSKLLEEKPVDITQGKSKVYSYKNILLEKH